MKNLNISQKHLWKINMLNFRISSNFKVLLFVIMWWRKWWLTTSKQVTTCCLCYLPVKNRAQMTTSSHANFCSTSTYHWLPKLHISWVTSELGFLSEVKVSKNKHCYNGQGQVSLALRWNDQRRVVHTSSVVIMAKLKSVLCWVGIIKIKLVLLHWCSWKMEESFFFWCRDSGKS